MGGCDILLRLWMIFDSVWGKLGPGWAWEELVMISAGMDILGIEGLGEIRIGDDFCGDGYIGD